MNHIMFKKIALFFQGVQSEFKKVTWSTKEQILRQTGIVLSVVFTMSIFIGAIDWLLSYMVQLVL